MWNSCCTCVVLVFLFIGCYAQKNNVESPKALHSGLSERIGNFSLVLLYHSSQAAHSNLIVSPITVWTTMAVLYEASANTTQTQLRKVLGVGKNAVLMRKNFQNIFKFLVVNTTTVQLENLNTIFTDVSHPIETPYKDLIQRVYNTQAVTVNFLEAEKTAKLINNYVATATHQRITELVHSGDLSEAQMILTNAVYFKGQWTMPFNTSDTTRAPFYDDNNREIGQVNMMYNRGVYPYANMNDLQARVIELPYGKEDRLSMLIMLPHMEVSLQQMFQNFLRVPLDNVFKSLQTSMVEFEGDEVDCYLPRFKINTDLVLNKPLQDMGIIEIFEQDLAQLPLLSKNPLYVSRVIHKAEIEVTEDGTVAAAVNAAELANRNTVSKFIANHPFAYLIIEKITNVIVFGGIYVKPALF